MHYRAEKATPRSRMPMITHWMNGLAEPKALRLLTVSAKLSYA